MALQALTDGRYDAGACRFTDGRGNPKRYLATDHLESPRYARLTPEDLLDILVEHGLGWDEPSMTGVAFHMLSALAVAGRVGATAIGDSPEQAEAMLAGIRAMLDEESAREPRHAAETAVAHPSVRAFPGLYCRPSNRRSCSSARLGSNRK